MEEKEKNIIRERNKKARRHPCLPTTDRGATERSSAYAFVSAANTESASPACAMPPLPYALPRARAGAALPRARAPLWMHRLLRRA